MSNHYLNNYSFEDYIIMCINKLVQIQYNNNTLHILVGYTKYITYIIKVDSYKCITYILEIICNQGTIIYDDDI